MYGLLASHYGIQTCCSYLFYRELYSSGTQPYTGMSNVETTEYVLQGNRLAKPEACPDQVFEIMKACWAEKAKDRPTMVAVHGSLRALLKVDSEEKPRHKDYSGSYNTYNYTVIQ